MTLRRPQPLRIAVLALALLLLGFGTFGSLTPAQAVGSLHAPIVGSGSTWSANALQQWIRNVWSNYQWKITYSESGSTQGRNDFANGTADFGVSEIPYGIANSNEADQRPGRPFAYMPIVAGGTAFMYNLEIGGRRVTNLRLSGENLAKVFTGVITTWNDPAIQADNPQLALPATPIVPVVRSDGSGTSAQFTIWMRQEQPALWDAYCGKVGRQMINGHCGVTSNYPTLPGSGFIARSGANGVAGYVSQAHAVGTITFVEYSYALNTRFPVVKMLNSSGYYTEPTAGNVAVALLSARINEDVGTPDYLTQDLSQVYKSGDPRTYPLSSYSYIILPTDSGAGFNEDKGLTLSAFGSYFLCEGQQQAETLGYSPLPVNLVQGAQRQIQRVPGGDPAVTGFAVSGCNNPTLDPSDPDGNALAKSAAFPEECDRQGPTQCARGTGGAKDTSTPPSGAGAAGAAGATSTGGGGSASGDAGAAGAAAAAGSAGARGDGSVDVASAPVLVQASPQGIAAASVGLLPVGAMLAAGGGLLAAAIVPSLWGARSRGGVRRTPVRLSSRGGTR